MGPPNPHLGRGFEGSLALALPLSDAVKLLLLLRLLGTLSLLILSQEVLSALQLQVNLRTTTHEDDIQNPSLSESDASVTLWCEHRGRQSAVVWT